MLNPIIPGYYPDPSICRVGEDFYLVNSSFEFFPGLPIWHSRDLVSWEQIGHVLTRRSQLELGNARPSGGLYAPTIRFHDGLFYVFCTNVSNGGNFFVTAESPYGEWSEPVWVNQGGIDPSPFFDDDGKVYFTSTFPKNGVSGIGVSVIDIKTGKRLTETEQIWTGSFGRCPEGAHIYKLSGYYYLMLAEGGTEMMHMETIARAKSPFGPYEGCPYNPILTNHNEHNENPVSGTGHADLVEAPDGSWWAVFLGFRLSENYFHHMGRETFLAPVTWTEDGWPVINGGKPVYEKCDYKTLPSFPVEQEKETDDFSSGILPMWCFLRNPDMSNYSAGDGLELTGSADTLMGLTSAPTALFRRQRHFDMYAKARLDAPEIAEGGRCGLTVFYQNRRHFDVYIAKKGGKTVLGLFKVMDEYEMTYEIPWSGGAEIRVNADKLTYRFSAVAQDGREYPLGEALTRHVSTESAKLGFTGVMLGLFAEGGCKARFTSFSYGELK
ncbi:MAG: glycoside hydrolase family 43 protein [Eubacteriales bacterium]|nr:glycoside hydrolase family 43 protein [Eubacteriales bacterium]MDD3880774.1 glycoside hydrolase family 43 protein [Eubacteriales bacterium]MDD3882879.1 glycoside hydrolase family 43 protein [Eubacteriales bacterium]MDD4511593.1 glycoside hydrolase family 43 protein [Eubacteriales bacterium]